jgi:hypothetical protein
MSETLTIGGKIMVPGKESLIFFEDLAKRQEQIYPDACDHGVIVKSGAINRESANLKEQINFHARSLTDIYKSVRLAWDNGASLSLNIPFEKDEAGRFVGVNLHLGFNIDRKRSIHFLSINIIHKNLGYSSPFLPVKMEVSP